MGGKIGSGYSCVVRRTGKGICEGGGNEGEEDVAMEQRCRARKKTRGRGGLGKG